MIQIATSFSGGRYVLEQQIPKEALRVNYGVPLTTVYLPGDTMPTDGPSVPPNVEVGHSFYNVREFGAKGDGVSRPLSAVFSSLADATHVYPSAVSLSEEIDFNAVRLAVETAKADGGGTVYVPRGRYMMNNVASPIATIVFPECRPSGTAGIQVNMRGDGWRNSLLRWPADAGTNGSAFALSCGDPTAVYGSDLARWGSGGFYEGTIEDIQFHGPASSKTVGVKSVNLSGLAWGSRRRLNRVVLRGFYAGLDIVGDWSVMESVYTPDCYYGMYFPRKSPYLYGNIEFIKCFFNGVSMAGIGLGPNGYMRGIFHGCFIGGGPYGIMMEPGDGVTMTHIISRFQDCQFEFLGNAMICDENSLNGGTKRLAIERTSFECCSIARNSAYGTSDGGRNTDCLVSAKSMKDVAFSQVADFPDGAQCVFDLDTVQGVTIDGNLFFLDDLPVPLLINASGIHTFLLRDKITGWSGRMVRMSASEGCTVRDLLEFDSGRARRCTTSPNPMLGVAQSTVGPNAYVPVATRGSRLTVSGSGTITANTWLKKAAGGTVAIATDANDGVTAGYAETADVGNSRFGISLSGRNGIGDI